MTDWTSDRSDKASTGNTGHDASTPGTGRASSRKPSIGALLNQITEQFSRLVRAELESFKKELTTKLTRSGIGIGLFAAAGVLALYGLGFLLYSITAAISLALPMWASALIVAGSLFLICGILAFVGKKQLEQGTPPAPTETIASVKQDIKAVKEGLS
ncbi:phage holin family protein [Jonesia quinghaiensis]|uniref:phage holin family protein n=1 Tax=Jonesia quinghaiensis TaxID=262806 RepID=UPI0003FF6D16|nr:phage holin family protein [Jonesia quinghaiensis]